MVTFGEVEKVHVCQQNVTALPPFTTQLPVGSTVPLCSVTVPLCRDRGRDRDAFLVRAVVNWSATFDPIITILALTGLGFAQVTFEVLRDGVVIGRVTQTINQPNGVIGILDLPFEDAVTGFNIATIEVLDTTSLIGCAGPIAVFELRATNIIVVEPINALGTVITILADVFINAGLISLVVEEIDACCRAASV